MQLLKGDKVLLRALEPEDTEVLYKWENDTSIWQISNTLAPYSKFAIEQYIFNNQDIYTQKQIRLIIEFKKTPIGCIDIFDYEPTHKRAGIGILIVENYRKKGYAKDALKTLINYCFNILQLHQLYCNIMSDNKESIKLFTKTGFKIIGKKADWYSLNNSWKDEYILQLIKD